MRVIGELEFPDRANLRSSARKETMLFPARQRINCHPGNGCIAGTADSNASVEPQETPPRAGRARRLTMAKSDILSCGVSRDRKVPPAAAPPRGPVHSVDRTLMPLCCHARSVFRKGLETTIFRPATSLRRSSSTREDDLCIESFEADGIQEVFMASVRLNSLGTENGASSAAAKKSCPDRRSGMKPQADCRHLSACNSALGFAAGRDHQRVLEAAFQTLDFDQRGDHFRLPLADMGCAPTSKLLRSADGCPSLVEKHMEEITIIRIYALSRWYAQRPN